MTPFLAVCTAFSLLSTGAVEFNGTHSVGITALHVVLTLGLGTLTLLSYLS